MKKTTAAITVLIFLMVFALVSCSTKSQNTDSPNDDPANTSDVSDPPQSGAGDHEDVEEPEDVKEPGEPDTPPPPTDPPDGQTDSSTDNSPDNTPDNTPDSSTDSPPETTPPAGDIGIAQLAQALIGIPFLAGGDTPDDGFDNSGFIYYVLNQNGISCPRRTRGQVSLGEHVTDYAELIPGDLVFFSSNPESGEAEFGGIYIGGGKMIYCSSGAGSVQESSITQAWYREAFVFGVSIG